MLEGPTLTTLVGAVEAKTPNKILLRALWTLWVLQFMEVISVLAQRTNTMGNPQWSL